MKIHLILIPWLINSITSKLVAIYWGQGAGGNEKNLREYCTDKSIDIIIITYLSLFDGRTAPKLGIKTQCTSQWCVEIGGDIRFCQSQGKKVILSLGGSPTGRYVISSEDIAEQFANQIYTMFIDKSNSIQPLGEVSLDGIDLSINNMQGLFYTNFVSKFRQMGASYGKSLMVTASPGCKLPDPTMNDVIQNGNLDFLLVKFYNDGTCESDSNMNIMDWDALAQSTNSKLLIGISGTRNAVKSGYLPAEVIQRRLNAIQKSVKTYSGVALFDAGGAFGDDGIGKDVANYVHSAGFNIKSSSLLTILTVILISTY